MNRKPGTYTTKVPIILPENAAKGTYEVKVALSTPGRSNELTSRFIVQ